MPNNLKSPRKRTIFVWCDRHALCANNSRRRQAEIMTEGGPGNSPCAPGSPCRMFAGTDQFISGVCTGEYPLTWTNR